MTADNSERDPLQRARIEKGRTLSERGIPTYRNGFVPTERMGGLRGRIGDLDTIALEARPPETVRIAGRILAVRSFGKAVFLSVVDGTGALQLFVRHGDASEAARALLPDLDVGDFVGAEGRPMRTRTGELSLLVRELTLLTKAVRPLPEKWHGLQDIAARYRQRYVDLVANPEVADVVRARAVVLASLRRTLDERGFWEVETPVMGAVASGAVARPFTTHHNTLDLKLHLRVAPELYLKRLLVGGLDRVYEIARCFRNEGVSARHNPEFTMLEAYQAYATYEDAMVLVEVLVRGAAKDLRARLPQIAAPFPDLNAPFPRVRLLDAVAKAIDFSAEKVRDAEVLRTWHLNVTPPADRAAIEKLTWGERAFAIFEERVEPTFGTAPVFVIDYPADVSPLARRKDGDPTLVDRFELYVGGREVANAFSELNDPAEQLDRFKGQADARARGRSEDEAMAYDADYVRALEYGMPPAAGIGIGVDRLLMLLTCRDSIREVITFPLLRPDEGY